MLAYDWDVLFKPGIAAADPGETPKYKEGESVPHSLDELEQVTCAFPFPTQRLATSFDLQGCALAL